MDDVGWHMAECRHARMCKAQQTRIEDVRCSQKAASPLAPTGIPGLNQAVRQSNKHMQQKASIHGLTYRGVNNGCNQRDGSDSRIKPVSAAAGSVCVRRARQCTMAWSSSVVQYSDNLCMPCIGGSAR